MSEQPEALRLADELCAPMSDYPAPTSLEDAAAAELRRLYQLAQEQHTVIYGLRLEVRNLLKATQKRPPNCGTGYCSCIECVMKPAPVPPVATLFGSLPVYDTTPPAQPAPVQEPDELKHIGEQDSLLDVDESAWHLLVENRGGCRCHISPPCSACSNPISEEEMNEVGYTYTTPPAAQRQWVGLTDDDIEQEFGFIDELLRDCVYRTEAKVREKNT